MGATPVQNVGAYGVEVSEFIASVRTWDRETGKFKTFANADLRFGYRDSILKQNMVNGSPRYVVLTVDFQSRSAACLHPLNTASWRRAWVCRWEACRIRTGAG